MTFFCFLLDLRTIPPPLLSDLKQSLLQLANLYVASRGRGEGSVQGRDPDAWRSDRIVLHPERRKPSSLSDLSKESCRLGDLKDHKKHMLDEKECGQDPLEDLKHRFLSFKRKPFLENRIHYENLSEGQASKIMVIACADSRVCPSRVLGFQPGEAFTVRNVANLVPPFQHETSEPSAALEFAVNSLEVVIVLVVGHSRCVGIRALMSMKDESDSRSFIRD